MTPAPQPFHQEVVGRLFETLRPFVRQHDLGRVIVGPIDVLFAEGDYLEPDLVFVRRDRRDIIGTRGVEGAPDLVIEVVSPTGGLRDRGLKRDRYSHFGVAEYWVVDPGMRMVEIYRLGAAKPVVASKALEWQPVPAGPILHLDLAELFSDPD
jgi:Uma2 family endonuclease